MPARRDGEGRRVSLYSWPPIYPSGPVSSGDVASLCEASRGGEQYGDERLWELLDRHSHRRAADVVEELMGAVRGWADGPLDDLTIVVLKQLARGRLVAAT